MTEEKLATATATLATVQDDLVTGPEPIFTPNTILLGHSLECDLTAMKIRHALCIDTALIYKHPRGPPYKPGLKWLAQRYLHREIQASTKGHDSEEDAQTCVDLLKMKMANGPEFGSFMDTSESIFERINRYSPETVRRRTAYCDYGSTKGGPGAKATSVAKCTSDEEVLENMATFVQDHEFVFGRMMELAQFQGCGLSSISPQTFAETRGQQELQSRRYRFQRLDIDTNPPLRLCKPKRPHQTPTRRLTV